MTFLQPHMAIIIPSDECVRSNKYANYFSFYAKPPPANKINFLMKIHREEHMILCIKCYVVSFKKLLVKIQWLKHILD